MLRHPDFQTFKLNKKQMRKNDIDIYIFFLLILIITCLSLRKASFKKRGRTSVVVALVLLLLFFLFKQTLNVKTTRVCTFIHSNFPDINL